MSKNSTSLTCREAFQEPVAERARDFIVKPWLFLGDHISSAVFPWYPRGLDSNVRFLFSQFRLQPILWAFRRLSLPASLDLRHEARRQLLHPSIPISPPNSEPPSDRETVHDDALRSNGHPQVESSEDPLGSNCHPQPESYEASGHLHRSPKKAPWDLLGVWRRD